MFYLVPGPCSLALRRPWEVEDGEDQEARISSQRNCSFTEHGNVGCLIMDAYLFESSAIPARALYHAMKAANKPKKPPALMTGSFGLPPVFRR